MANPVPMSIGQVVKALTRVLQEAPQAERNAFKDAWLASVPEFNKRTEEIRFENWKRS